jgi:ribosomal protein S18 acetylase RimI-like enzyme
MASNTRIPKAELTGIYGAMVKRMSRKMLGDVPEPDVLPEYRNQGIGTHLLDRLEQELADAGATDLILGTLPGNAAAIRMYERRGFQSTWLYMSRFAGRPESRNR